ncbi:hypothetical protein C8R47DRAFT_1225130 [Mycena vitilis]|nr:hypothetical protein C8R47DRAFT_1225130 [Mycena vitilis]
MLCPRPPILFPRLDFQCRYEHTDIDQAWRLRDRSAVHSYEEFLAVRATRDAKLACSKAIARKRTALAHRFDFGNWVHQHATGEPMPADRFGGAPHRPGVWHSYRNRDGTWGPHGGIMDASRWVTTTAVTPWPSRRVPGTRDPDWDGTPVARTPGKARRRRRRMLLELEEDAAIAAAELEAAWSYDVWFATWGHNCTWGKRDDGARL